MVLDTPYELFDKFMAISTYLPADAKGWPANLSYTFQSALTNNLSDTIANDTDFKQPELTPLTTKALQLDALRQVRSHDVTHFKKLQDQKTQIDDAVRSLMGSRRHGNVNDNFPELENNQQLSSGPTYYQQNSSQAEQTIQRHKPNDRDNLDERITQPDVPTEYNLSTGQLHPWNEERKYLSKFPISFCRCFICGNTDHIGLRDCPIAKDGKYDKKKFFEEL